MSLNFKSIILTVYNKDATSYAVTWQTEKPGKPVFQYRKQGGGDFITIDGYISDSTAGYKNYAVMPDLEYNTFYEYRVGDADGIWSETFLFRTVRGLDSEVSFYYFADSQDENNLGEWWKPAWKHAEEHFPDVDFVLHGGDIVQESGNQWYWDEMLGRNIELVSRIPFIASCGNHDYWEFYLHGYKHTFRKHVSYDLVEQNTENGIYYTCRQGHVQFFILNSGADFDPDSQQYKWFVSEIEKCDTKWKIVMIHNPLYSPGKYGSRPGLNDLALALRKIFNPLFAKYSVDLVFSGHDHVYSKSYPVLSDGSVDKEYEFIDCELFGEIVKTSVNPKGPIHFVTGPAGNQARNCHDSVDERYFEDLDEFEDTPWEHVAYSYVSVKDDKLCLIYKLISVQSGEELMTKSFAIKK